MSPALLVRGVKSDEVEAMSARVALDEWLDAPSGKQAAAEKALMTYLGVA